MRIAECEKQKTACTGGAPARLQRPPLPELRMAIGWKSPSEGKKRGCIL